MKKKTIWTIDDDIIYQTIIKKLIQKSEMYAPNLPFYNGDEAITALKNLLNTDSESLPDIILLDINMPILDGWGFIEEFQKIKSNINKKISIYIVSSSIASDDIKKASAYTEVVKYLSKPLLVNTLIDIALENNSD